MESTANGPRKIGQSSESKAAPIAPDHVDLRDYFAAHAPMQTLPSSAGVDWTTEIRVACEEMGITREESNYDEDALGFWCRVEAFRRYRYADAMLRAREAKA